MDVIKKSISEWFGDLQADIIARAKAKSQNVSNKIPKSFKQTFADDGDVFTARLVAWGRIVNAWEVGRGKRKSTKKTDFEEKLARWIKRKGLKMNPKSLRWWINKHGTRLHRGNDPRFSGKKSGTITDFINKNSTNKFVEKLADDIVKAEISPLIDFTK